MTAAQGSGKMSTSITVFSFAPGATYPTTGRHEVGGVSVTPFETGPRVYYFGVDFLTSPYAELPPVPPPGS